MAAASRSGSSGKHFELVAGSEKGNAKAKPGTAGGRRADDDGGKHKGTAKGGAKPPVIGKNDDRDAGRSAATRGNESRSSSKTKADRSSGAARETGSDRTVSARGKAPRASERTASSRSTDARDARSSSRSTDAREAVASRSKSAREVERSSRSLEETRTRRRREKASAEETVDGALVADVLAKAQADPPTADANVGSAPASGTDAAADAPAGQEPTDRIAAIEPDQVQAAVESADAEQLAAAGAGEHAHHEDEEQVEPVINEPAKGDVTIDQHVELQRGDTLAGVLAANGVSPDEAQEWVTAANNAYDLKRLFPRRGLTLRFDRDSRALEGILYEIDENAKLVIEQTPRGIAARQEGLPTYIEVRGAASKITRKLREDANRIGVPPSVVATLADVFGWEADVEADPASGDEFRVLYEHIWRAGEAYPETGRMIAAELVRNGQRTQALYYQDESGSGGYYKPTGEAVSQAFLRYPVEFTEITSGFGWRRHPILRVGRQHKGIDFAAPVGTPIHAASDGRVVKLGWMRGYGRCVKVEHLEGYLSTYAHMSAFAENLSEGDIVERGQVIGYVGSSGRSTGPHLHYEVERYGEALDPLEMTAMPEQPVIEAQRPMFDRVKATAAKQMAVLPVDETTRIVAGTTMAAPSAAWQGD